MGDSGKLIALCPNHLRSLDFKACTPGQLDQCSVDMVRKMKSEGKASRSKTVVIPDDIQALKVSKQRKLQLAWGRLGLCMICGTQTYGCTYCLYHRIKTRERQRRKRGSKRRNFGASSYVGEMPPTGPPVGQGEKK